MPGPRARSRVNDIALARFERWALPRMARQLPAWVTPDALSALGIAAAALIAGSYLLTHLSLHWLWLASAGFVVHWWADSLDGTLARVRGIQRERYGFFVDHQCDAISTLLIFGGLGLSPLMPLTVALAIIVGYYLMMILVYLTTIATNVFKISFGVVGPTEARLAMILINTLVVLLQNPILQIGPIDTTLFGLIGGIGAAALLGIYLYSTIIQGRKLAHLDPPPRPDNSQQHVTAGSSRPRRSRDVSR